MLGGPEPEPVVACDTCSIPHPTSQKALIGDDVSSHEVRREGSLEDFDQAALEVLGRYQMSGT